MSVWETVKLGDICEILDYKRIPLSSAQRQKRKGVYPYYGAQGIIDYVDDYIFSGTYLLVAEDGNNLLTQKENVAIISTGKFWVNNHAHVLAYNGKCDLYLLGYILNSTDISGYITGSAQPKLNQANLVNIKLKIPPIEEQSRIVSVLKSLDFKIENNNKINANLEAQAQALFKSWFVDYEPFQNGEFEDSELGRIPKGWKVEKAENVYEINIGKTPPRKEHEWFSEIKRDNIWVSIADMGNCGVFIDSSSEFLTDEAIKKFNILLVPKNTILVSFKMTIGRVCIADNILTTNEAIARFIIPSIEFLEFTYLQLKNYKYEGLGSTSSIAIAVNSKIIKAMPLLLPPEDIIYKFHKIVSPMFENIRALQKQNKTLSLLRDTLLPKLMSGEIEV